MTLGKIFMLLVSLVHTVIPRTLSANCMQSPALGADGKTDKNLASSMELIFFGVGEGKEETVK